MGLTVDDAREMANMRLKIVQNMQAGKPAEHGIDEEKLAAVLDKVRKDRSLGELSNSKAKGKAPEIPMDLEAFMNKPVSDG